MQPADETARSRPVKHLGSGSSPLAGVRIIDMANGTSEACGRLLADLGADVIVVEPPSGANARSTPPFFDGESLYAAVRHANKRSVSLDLQDEQARTSLLRLLAGADIWIEGGTPLELYGLGANEVFAQLPHLVIVSISDFGRTGPYKDYRANDWVLMAMGGVLSRSGLPGRPPLMPPAQIAGEATAVQAAWSALVAFWNKLETGHGDVIDFSLFEATAQILDPALGSIGTAAAAQGGRFTRGRPATQSYPIFGCADGHVRLVVLSKRQWRGLRAWLGEPEILQDPKYDEARERFADASVLQPFINELFSKSTVADVVTEGQRRGVPVAPVLTIRDALHSGHYAARAAFRDIRLKTGAKARAAAGYLRVDEDRAGYRRAAPAVGEHTAEILGAPIDQRARPSKAPDRRRPLEGLRVLDLGVIVVGAEAGRLFADLGAEVIKIESRAYPDGSRAEIQGRITPAFAAGHRNKLSFGLNLRTTRGVEIFRDLAAASDVVLSNFKPGTLDGLGLSPEELRALNPRLVVVTCSAMGADGPWATWMGYGPLVRCATGLTSLWRYPEEAEGFSDTVTIYPDHLVGRLVDTAAIAALLARRKSGRGALIECSQAEVIINALADVFLAESLMPGFARPLGNHGERDAPWSVFPCAGDDEWCVVTVDGDDDFRRLANLIGRGEWLHAEDFATREMRIRHRNVLEAGVRQWTLHHSPRAATALLQGAGVAAGFMARVNEYADDPHLSARRFIRHVDVEGLETLVRMENGPFRSLRMSEPEIRCSPRRGEHTVELCGRLLGLNASEIRTLIEEGVIEPPDPLPATQSGAAIPTDQRA